MAEKEIWKKTAKYGIGVAVLAASVGAAWFVPGWYSGWQDSKLLDQVVVSSREDIQFLDVDALDIAGVMKMLSNADYYGWNYQEYEVTGVQRIRQAVKEWEDLHMVPQGITRWIGVSDTNMEGTYTVYTSQGSLSVNVVQFCKEEDFALTVVMDADKDLIYYLSFSGDYFWNQLLEELRFETVEDLEEANYEGTISDMNVCDAVFQIMTCQQSAEYAVPVNAESAETEVDYENWGFTVKLYFDAFEGQALARVINSNDSVGCAVMYGSSLWANFVSDMSEAFGGWERPVAVAWDMGAASDAMENQEKTITGKNEKYDNY